MAHATLGTISSTLNAGTVFVTLIPNYNISLQDPHALDCLKVQVQITGAPLVATAVAATLYYQIAYKIQNHAFDIPVPDFAQNKDALFLKIDAASVPTCTYIPRQMPVEELQALLPTKWTTQYENLHGRNEAVSTAQPSYTHKADGSVETAFQSTQETKIIETFPSIFTMEPVVKHQDCDCTCEDCLEDSYQVELDLEYERKYMHKRKSKRSPQQLL